MKSLSSPIPAGAVSATWGPSGRQPLGRSRLSLLRTAMRVSCEVGAPAASSATNS